MMSNLVYRLLLLGLCIGSVLSIDRRIKNLSIPGLSFSAATFDCAVSDVKVSNFGMSAAVSVDPKLGLVVTMKSLSFDLKGSYSYREQHWPHHPEGSGAVTAHVTGSSSALAFSLKPGPNGTSTVVLSSCNLDVGLSNLKFQGSMVSSLMNMFKSTIKKHILSAVHKEACKTLTDFVALSAVQVPPMEFIQDTIKCSISSLNVSDISIGANLQIDHLLGLVLSIQHLSFKLSAGYAYREEHWPNVPRGEGVLTGSVTSNSSKMALDLVTRPDGTVGVVLTECNLVVGVSDLVFHGGIVADMLDWFASTIEGNVDTALNTQVCAALRTALNPPDDAFSL